MIAALFLAIALAMDAFAVALAQGAQYRPGKKESIVIALAFGVAQGTMVALGWGLGTLTFGWIDALDHWIAFALLTAIGLHMIRPDKASETRPLLCGIALLAAAIATSVDALGAGVAIPTIDFPPPLTVALIAGVALVLSLGGIAIGSRMGERFGRPAEMLGGVLLIALGSKIVAEHTGLI